MSDDLAEQLDRDADTLEGLAADGIVSLDMSRRVRRAAEALREAERPKVKPMRDLTHDDMVLLLGELNDGDDR